jgi:hypothetical protein
MLRVLRDSLSDAIRKLHGLMSEHEDLLRRAIVRTLKHYGV